MRQAREWWGASRRRRRRITWVAVLLVVTASVSSLVVWLRDTGPSYETPTHPGRVQVYHAPKQAPLTHAALLAARLTTFNFIRTAVLRDHVEDSWVLMAPVLRRGFTRRRWGKGDIPVVPYPVDLKTVRYQVDYSYASGGPDGLPLLGLEVAMAPKAGEHVQAMRFGIELEAAGTGARQHWVVASWGPRGQLGGEPQGARPTPASELPTGHSLSTVWLLVPALLLAGSIAIPLAFGVRSWIRNRRIARTYTGT